MNKDLFLKYVENSRDCDPAQLDTAVSKGIRRAHNDRFDAKKLFMLAAASVFTFALCFTVNLMPFSTVVERYYRNRREIMPGSSEILNSYINDISINLEKYLGGK
jgi:hypothetical protein